MMVSQENHRKLLEYIFPMRCSHIFVKVILISCLLESAARDHMRQFAAYNHFRIQLFKTNSFEVGIITQKNHHCKLHHAIQSSGCRPSRRSHSMSAKAYGSVLFSATETATKPYSAKRFELID